MRNIDDELSELVAKALECEIKTITPDSGLGKHYKWDSLGHVAVMVALEEKYGINVDDSNIHHLSNYTSIKDYIYEYAK